MKVLRHIASGVIVAIAVYAVIRTCVVPLRCSVSQQRLENFISSEFDSPSTTRIAAVSRGSLSLIDDCLCGGPDNAAILMLKAALLRMLQRPSDAERAYVESLRFDRRPEIYLELGVTQLESGNRNAAIASLTRAAAFDPRLLAQIPDLEARRQVERAVVAELHLAREEPHLHIRRTPGGAFPRTYSASELHGEIGEAEGDVRVAHPLMDSAGWLVFGPSEELPAGHYRVTFRLRLEGAAFQQARPAVKLDVTADAGQREHAVRVVSGGDLSSAWTDYTVAFATPEILHDVEYRVYWYGRNDVACAEIRIYRD